MLWQGKASVGKTSVEYKHFILLLLLLVGPSNAPAAATFVAVVVTSNLYRFRNVRDFIALYLVRQTEHAKAVRRSARQREKLTVC